jgi:hypothetical protein
MEDNMITAYTKDAIIRLMNDAYTEDGYHAAYKVFETVSIPYPEDNTENWIEDTKKNFVGTYDEIQAELARVKEKAKESYRDRLYMYNQDTAAIRAELLKLAAIDSLPREVAENENFIKATSYYALSMDEPYNWASEYSDFWDTFEKANEALKGE